MPQLSRHALTYIQWESFQAFLPKPNGRHANDQRLFLDAILWIGKTGSPWRGLPSLFGLCNSLCQHHAYWCSKGHFETLSAAFQEPDLEELMIDSTCCKAHQASSGAQKNGPLALVM